MKLVKIETRNLLHLLSKQEPKVIAQTQTHYIETKWGEYEGDLEHLEMVYIGHALPNEKNTVVGGKIYEIEKCCLHDDGDYYIGILELDDKYEDGYAVVDLSPDQIDIVKSILECYFGEIEQLTINATDDMESEARKWGEYKGDIECITNYYETL